MTGETWHGEVFELLRRLDIEVRQEHCGGAGGGLCAVRNRKVLFVDLDSDLTTQDEMCLDALRSMPEIKSMYVTPALRARLTTKP